MSIDNSTVQKIPAEDDSTVSPSGESKIGSPSLDWPSLVLGKPKAPAKIFGEAVKDGGIYRWGMSVATTNRIPDSNDDELDCEDRDNDQDIVLLNALSRLACDLPLKKKQKTRDWTSTDWTSVAEQAIEQFETLKDPTADQATMAVVWAAALPQLQSNLNASMLADLTHALLELREAVLLRDDIYSSSHLIIGGELGLVLAWRLPGLRSRKAILQSAVDAVAGWLDRDEESISAAVAGATSARLALASLIRSRRLMKTLAKRKFTEQNIAVSESLATWVAALTGPRGTSAFSNAGPKGVKADCGKYGLLQAAKQFDPVTIGLAMDAAMGKGHSGGRLAWEVSLPESMWCDESGKVAVLLPEWDVARGRTHIDFAGQDVSVEVFAGQTVMLAGALKTNLEIDGDEQQPDGDWEEICRYSDDDVHYLELEQTWTAGYVIQRQFLLLREDRCLMVADAVIPRKAVPPKSNSVDWVNSQTDPASIVYQVSLPLAENAAAIEEQETREVILRSTGGAKRDGNQAMVLPLSGSEWKIGPTKSKLILADPDRLVYQASGSGRLYAPLWIDFTRRRLKRMRTWRPLTVCDSLQLVPRNEAAAFRVQVGAEQWAIYRSLVDQRCRSFLGKHIMADFYVSRFDTGDGTHDALITVDDGEGDHS